MQIPRLSETLLVNNLWLLGLTAVLVLVALWSGLVGGMVIVRWLFRTSRVQALVRLGDGMVKLARTIAMLSMVVLLLGSLGLMAYSIWRGTDFQVWADTAMAALTMDLLWVLASMAGTVFGLVVVCLYFYRMGKVLLPRVEERLTRMPAVRDHAEAVAEIFVDLPRYLTLILVYATVYYASYALAVSARVGSLLVTMSFIVMVAGLSRLLVQVCQLGLTLFDGYMVRLLAGRSSLAYYEKVRQLRPLIRRVIEAVVYIGVATLIVGQFATLGAFARSGPVLIKLITLFLLTRVAIELVGTLLLNVMLRDTVETEAEASSDESIAPEARQRRVTLAHLLQRLVKYLFYIGMALWMLVIVGINPVPLVAAAGVVGFAVGLGSQKILQDVICGFFMLFEDQMLIGDYVKIGDTEGVVEHLFLRVVRIRDRLGRVHIVRNGDIANVINYSRGWTLAVVEMSVAYEADLSVVMDVMTGVGKKLHETMPKQVLAPAQVKGIEGMDDSCLRVRIEAQVKPGCHYDVKWVLNRLLFEAFVDNGLEIPYPKGIEFESVPGTSTAGA